MELPVAADAPGAPHFGAQEGAGAVENRCIGRGDFNPHNYILYVICYIYIYYMSVFMVRLGKGRLFWELYLDHHYDTMIATLNPFLN